MAKAFWAICLLFCAAAATALTPPEARHLLGRAGMGASPGELQAMLPLDWEQAVDRMLAVPGRGEPKVPPPAFVSEEPPDPKAMRALSEEQRREYKRQINRNGQELKAWWYREMLATDSPLTERMTLFWHNHFTSSFEKVHWPQALYRQNALLRREALGSFRRLLHGIASDPAMLVYLDGAANRRGKPNENFARELLELFTMGEGHYSEQDIKEAARAFTGWSVDRATARFTFNAKQHDDGVKTFMGRTGNFDGDEILDIILAQPRTAEHIVGKLWREFISEAPEPQEVRRLAGIYRDANYEMKPLLRALLVSRAFRDPRNRGVLVKSPVELMVGTMRTFAMSTTQTMPLVQAGRRLGQDIFDPPNVKGWPGGTLWINTDSMLVRRQILEAVLRQGGAGAGWRPDRKGRPEQPEREAEPKKRQEAAARRPGAIDLEQWIATLPQGRQEESFIEQVLVAVRPAAAPGGGTPQAMAGQGPMGQRVASLVLDPVYQLK